jgi:hypothetical protein
LRQASDKALPVVTDSLLAAHGKKFNRLFREVHITDSKRPAVVGALMLALWHTGKRGGALDTEADIKENVTGYCKAAFEHANDPDLVDVLVGELDVMLSKPEGVTAVKEILDDLRFLGVGTHHMSDLSADFLGQLYEARNAYYEHAARSVSCRLLTHCSAGLLRLLAGILSLHRRVTLATLTPCCCR